jgi:tetratricopeptide (TPR) repeat protein
MSDARANAPSRRDGRKPSRAGAVVAVGLGLCALFAASWFLWRSASSAEIAALEERGVALAREGRAGEALAPLLTVVRRDPSRYLARVALAELYARAGLFTPAATHLEAATRAAPDRAEYWFALGTCRLREFRYPEAATAFQRAASLEPRRAIHLLNLADAQGESQQLTEAEANYRRALALEPTNPDAVLRLVRFLVEVRSDTAAASEASRLLGEVEKAVPDNLYIPYYRGRVALARRDAGAAIADLKRVVSARPDVDTAWYALSRAYRLAGETAEADRAAREGRRIQDRREEARTLESLSRLRPEDASVHLRLARLNATQGQYAKAIYSYQTCLSLDPQNADARDELARLTARLRAEGKSPDMDAFDALVGAAVGSGK